MPAKHLQVSCNIRRMIIFWDRKQPTALLGYTVVWEKFTIGYFHMKIVCGKIFSSLRVSDENFLATNFERSILKSN